MSNHANNSAWTLPGLDDAHWPRIKAPLIWVVQGYPHYTGIAWTAWKGNQEARMLWFGVVIFGLTAMNDVFIDLVHISTPHLVPFGLFAIILFMMVSLANSFTRIQVFLRSRHDLFRKLK